MLKRASGIRYAGPAAAGAGIRPLFASSVGPHDNDTVAGRPGFRLRRDEPAHEMQLQTRLNYPVPGLRRCPQMKKYSKLGSGIFANGPQVAPWASKMAV